MSAVAIGLVLFSALLHASWNMLAKRAADPLAFIFAFNIVSVVVFAIPAAVMLQQNPVQADGMPFIFATGTIHVVYMFTLAGAAGIGAILLGLLAMAAPDRGAQILTIAAERRKGLIYAFITGLAIAAYSLVDKGGIERVHPMVYVYSIFLLATIGMAPFMIGRRRDAVLNEWRHNRGAVVVGGVLPLGTYLIVLLAMQIAAVSYVVPLRETSIVFSTLLGGIVLKEHISRVRLVASAMIAGGVLAIAIGG